MTRFIVYEWDGHKWWFARWSGSDLFEAIEECRREFNDRIVIVAVHSGEKCPMMRRTIEGHGVVFDSRQREIRSLARDGFFQDADWVQDYRQQVREMIAQNQPCPPQSQPTH